MTKQPVSYLQTDPRWKSISYSAKGESTTIGRAGCGPTAMSMVLATWANPAVTPKTECAWALSHGFKAPHQGTYYGYFVPAAKRYGLTCRQITPGYIYGNSKSPYHDQAKAELDKGNLVIACMGKGLWTSSGHYVLVWRIEGNTVYINDPASTRTARTRGDYSLFRQQVKLYWVIEAPKTIKKEEPDMTEKQTQALIEKALKAEREAIIAEVLAAMPTDQKFDTLDEVPEWAKDAVQRRMDLGILNGTGKGLGLSFDLLRQFVLQDREAQIKAKAEAIGMD